MAITYIDFYAENPIENKTIADSCIFENINGDGSALWTIYNSNDITITAEDTLYLNADRMWFNSSVEWTTIVSNSGMGFTTNPNSSGYSFTWNANGGKWDVDTKGGDIIFNTYNSSTLTYGAMVFPPVDKLQIGGGSNGQVLTTDGSAGLSWTTASGGGVADADYGDITVSGSGSVWTIDNSVVSYAKIQNVSTNNRLLGRSTASAGVVEEIIIGSGLTLTAGTLTASGGGGGYQIQADIITTSGTWTKPAFAKKVSVYILPGGGGGGSGARRATTSARCGGAGGSACGYTSAAFDATSLTSTVMVTIGAGGTGGASVSANDTNGNAGVAGGASSFGAYIATGTNGAGNGGTTSSSVSANSGFGPGGFLVQASGSFDGKNGTTSAGGNQTQTQLSFAYTGLPGGGGGGAGASSTTTASGGFLICTNWSTIFPTITFGTAGTSGGSGGNGSSLQIGSLLYLNTSGGGGSYATAQATGAGGNGGYGSGGGGGAASDNGNASGAGGNGGGGLIIVISEG